MKPWKKYGEKKMRIDDETSFIQEAIQKKILDGLTVHKNCTGKKLTNARIKSNPFEAIKSGIFQVNTAGEGG